MSKKLQSSSEGTTARNVVENSLEKFALMYDKYKTQCNELERLLTPYILNFALRKSYHDFQQTEEFGSIEEFFRFLTCITRKTLKFIFP